MITIITIAALSLSVNHQRIDTAVALHNYKTQVILQETKNDEVPCLIIAKEYIAKDSRLLSSIASLELKLYKIDYG